MKLDGVAKMSMSLDVQDKNKLIYFNNALIGMQYNLVMNPCAKFYEKTTGKSYIERDLPYERRQRDFSFEFVLWDCASQFYADTESRGGFRMIMFYREDRPFEFEVYTR